MTLNSIKNILTFFVFCCTLAVLTVTWYYGLLRSTNQQTVKIDWGIVIGVTLGMILFTLAAKMVLPKLGISAFEYEFERVE